MPCLFTRFLSGKTERRQAKPLTAPTGKQRRYFPAE